MDTDGLSAVEELEEMKAPKKRRYRKIVNFGNKLL